MRCFVNKVVTDRQVVSDIRTLIPDAGLRRRMSRVIRTAVSTAVECLGGVEGIDRADAIITATGFGLLTDSERFLRNMIADREQLLNPTPFIQSTFNTVGGQIALMRHNHCYNVTYVNRNRGFADAMLDALMRIADGESRTVLAGVFEEQLPAQRKILDRMGLRLEEGYGTGAMFALLAAECSGDSVAEITCLDFPAGPMTEEECLARYASESGAVLMTPAERHHGLFPLVPAQAFADAVGRIAAGEKEIVIYDGPDDGRPLIMVLRCIGR